MKPALTREEWEHWEELIQMEMYDEARDDAVENLCANWGNPQQIAAKCLHNQPFGFTREDVKMLDSVATGLGFQAMDLEAKGISSRLERTRQDALNSLADRIEALLPPKQNP